MNQGKGDWWIWDYSRDQVRLKPLQHSGIASFKYAECYNSLCHIKKRKESLIFENKQTNQHILDALTPFAHNKVSEDSLEDSPLLHVCQVLPHPLSGYRRQERLSKS